MKQYLEFKTKDGWYRILNEKLFYESIISSNLEEIEKKGIIKKVAGI